MFFKISKKNIISLLILACLFCAVAGFSLYSTPSVYSQSNGSKYYGGKIKRVTYCTCYYNFGVMLEVENKADNNKSLKIFYSPYLSRLRAYYNIWIAGPQVLGAYTPVPHACEMTATFGCSTYDTTSGTIDYVKGIGTTAR